MTDQPKGNQQNSGSLFGDDVSQPKRYQPQDPSEKQSEPLSTEIKKTSQPNLNPSVEIPTGQPAIKKPQFRQERNPDQEINQVIEELIWAVKEILKVQTVALVWVNKTKKQFIPETCISDTHVFVQDERIPFRPSSLLVKIVETGQPMVENKMTEIEYGELISHYSEPVQVSSFAGHPVFYQNEILAILFADHDKPNAFGGTEVGFMKRIASSISHLTFLYSRKEELEFNSRFMDVTDGFISELQRLKNIDRLVAEIEDVLNKTFEFQYGAIVSFNKDGEIVVVRSINKGQHDYATEGMPVNLNASLVGSIMRSLKPVNLKSTESSLDNRFRFHEKEKIKLSTSLMVAPVYSNDRCYGAIIVEHEKKGWFTGSQLSALDHIGFISGMVYENIVLSQNLEFQTVIDDETGVFTTRYFYDRLKAMVQQCRDKEGELSLAIYEYDQSETIFEEFGRESFLSALRSLGTILRNNFKAYDVVGRLDERHIAIASFDGGTDVHNKSLSIKNYVSAHPLPLENGPYPVTLSIGISRYKRERPTVEKLIEGAFAALDRSKESGGNDIKTT